MPTLAVLERLLNTGWMLEDDEPLAHTAESPRVLSSIASGPLRKHCWRCLLRLRDLLDIGLQGLRSDQRWEYYHLVLRSTDPVSVPLDLSSREYNVLMKGGTAIKVEASDPESSSSALPLEEDIAANASVATGPTKRRRVSSRHPVGDTGTDGDLRSIFGIATAGPSALEAASAFVAAPTAVPEIPLHAALPPPPCEHGMQFTVNGIVFTVSRWPLVETSWGPPQYTRYIVHCPLAGNDPKHAKCKKHRNAGPRQCTLGAWEPIAYLCQWVKEAKRCKNRQEHIATRLKPSTVKQIMKDNGWCSPCA